MSLLQNVAGGPGLGVGSSGQRAERGDFTMGFSKKKAVNLTALK